jgi:hypothetical protein
MDVLGSVSGGLPWQEAMVWSEQFCIAYRDELVVVNVTCDADALHDACTREGR